MSELNQNTENKEPIAEVKPLQLSSSNVVIATPIDINQNITEQQFNAMFDTVTNQYPNARFSGSASGNSLNADDSEPFDITIEKYPVTMNQKVTEVVTLREGQKALPSVIATNKIAVLAKQGGKVVPSNILVTPENKELVLKLIQNGTAKAITSHWETREKNADGTFKPLMTSGQNSRVVAKLVMFGNVAPIAQTTEAEIATTV